MFDISYSTIHILYIICIRIKSGRIYDVEDNTHKAPAPAGPIALKKDIAVAATPFAAPL